MPEKRLKREKCIQRWLNRENKEEDDYKQFQHKQLEEDEERRKLYREALEYQKGFQEYNKKNLGQMTYMEKKLNGKDLKTFKQNKPVYEGMVPGIHNIQSVGSRPLLRKANEDVYEQSRNPSSFIPKQLNRSYKEVKNSMKPLGDFASTNSPHKKDLYDPITNPVPFVNQNPYIMKEKSLIGGEGGSSLINHSHRRSQRSLLSATAEKNILI